MTVSSAEKLNTHLRSGLTSVCRCWLIERTDGVHLGFTDHDDSIQFNNLKFEASSGMDASAVQTSTGLSVDNAEAIGALTSDGVNEVDILSGRYDQATVSHWLANWQDVSERKLIFKGSIGEISRSQNTFEVELRGLSDAFNKPLGRVYMRQCDCTLGDGRCGVDLSLGMHTVSVAIKNADDAHVLEILKLDDYPEGAFEGGLAVLQSGDNQNCERRIAQDVNVGALRQLRLQEPSPFSLQSGDLVRLTVGCDRTPEVCKTKFNNFMNYRGFPDIPGEDWSFTRPDSSQAQIKHDTNQVQSGNAI